MVTAKPGSGGRQSTADGTIIRPCGQLIKVPSADLELHRKVLTGFEALNHIAPPGGVPIGPRLEDQPVRSDFGEDRFALPAIPAHGVEQNPHDPT